MKKLEHGSRFPQMPEGGNMQQGIRIGFVFGQDPTNVNAESGVPAHVLQCLKKLNVHVELYSPLSGRKKFLLAPLRLLANICKSKITLEHFPIIMKSYAKQISVMISQRPVDVIVSMSSVPVSLLKCQQPIIFWADAVIHDMLDYYGGAFVGMSPAAIERAKRQEVLALNNCTFAAYASEWAASSARRLTDPKKIAVLPRGASFDVRSTPAEVRQRVRQKWQERSAPGQPRTCKLLFIGVDWERKGGAIAVELARLLNVAGISTTLTVVGCAVPGTVPDFVQVLGFISKSTSDGRARLQALLLDADFFVLPTLAEAAGIVFCEASAFGLPMLSYATGGVPEYVRDGITGVCLPLGSPASAFASVIQQILQDSARYEALCLNAFNEYETRLNWDQSVRALLDLCESALTQRKSFTASGEIVHADA